MRRRDVLKFGALSAAALLSRPAWAQDRYPARPVHLVIPATPGGVHDIIGRVWAERSSRISAPLSSTIAAAAAA